MDTKSHLKIIPHLDNFHYIGQLVNSLLKKFYLKKFFLSKYSLFSFSYPGEFCVLNQINF